MELHVLLAGVEFGPYSDDKARQLLGEGFLSATDPAKRLDETEWLPLSDVLGQVPIMPEPPARSADAEPPAHEFGAPFASEEESPEEFAPEPEAEDTPAEFAAEAPVAQEGEEEQPEEEEAEFPPAAQPPPKISLHPETGESKPPTVLLPPVFAERPKTTKLPVSRPEPVSAAPPLTGQVLSRPAPEEIKSSFAKALAATRFIAATRSVTGASAAPAATATTESNPLPPATTRALPVTASPGATDTGPLLPTMPPRSMPVPSTSTDTGPLLPFSSARAATIPSEPAPSAPVAGVIPPVAMARPAKKAMVTGSLLAKEALHRARDRSGILPPTRKTPISTTTAPVPELEPEPAPPRKRTPVVLGDQEKLAPVPSAPQRKAIKLTGALSFPGTAPTTDRSGAEREMAAPSGLLARPGAPSRPMEPPVARQPVPILIQERREAGLVKPPARKAIRLTGPISLPGRITQPTPPIHPPALSEPEKPAPGISALAEPPPIPTPEPVEESAPVEAKAAPVETEPVEAKPEPIETKVEPAAEKAAEPFTTEPAPEEEQQSPLVHPAELAAAAALATAGVLATESGSLTKPESDLTSSGSLSSSGHLLSTGELAEKRSLKITGSLRQPPVVRPPIQLSSPSKPSDGVTLPTHGDLPDLSPEKPAPPVPEEELPNRPPSGKIPVADMPDEGVRIRRRLTAKVPLPEKPAEAIAHESPPRRLPPPLPPAKSIELLTQSAHPLPSEALSTPPVAEERPEPAPNLAEVPVADVPASPITSDIAEKEAELHPVEPLTMAAAGVAAAAAAAGAEVPSENVAKPERVRLRRPVKLELSSKAKIQDSGRLTLEAFSKMASLPATQPAPAAAAATPEPVTPEASAMIQTPREMPDSSVTPADFPTPRLTEAPAVAWRSGRPKPNRSWELLAYTIIGLGVAAVCLFIYLIHRQSSGQSPDTSTDTNVPTLPAEPPSAPPASASPPASATPPASTAPPVSVGPPAAANPPAVVATPAPTVTTSSNAAPVAPPPTNAAPAAVTPPVPSPVQNVESQANAFISDGILKYRNNDLDGAIASYNQALDLDPKSAKAFFNRGIAKARNDDLDGAIADYSSALGVDPNLSDAYYYRGLARHSKAELDGAIADYNQALQLDPKNAMAYFNRGLIRMQKNDFDGAIVDSTRALELDPHMIQSYYDRGLGRLAKGDADGALADMKQFTQLNPQDPYTDYARLYIWLIETQKGQLAEANQELKAAMNSGWNGASDSMVTRIGEFLLGQVGEEDLVKAAASTIPIKDQGQRCEVWYFIGMRKLEAGDRPSAIQALQNCVATQKTDYCEYILAQEALKNLGISAADAAPPKAIPVGLPDPGTMAPPTAPSP